MRILIDPGSHHLLNVGDVAMLQVCVARLREQWPHARIAVITAAPDLLERSCPGAEPVDAQGRYAWLRQPRATATPTPERRLARRLPTAAARRALGMEARRRRGESGDPAAFVRELLSADLFVLSGRGALTDAFADEAVAMLEELRMADAAGIPSAMLGQGIGPLGPELRRRAADVLSRVGAIALREDLVGPPLLERLGVPAARVHVTGDDAIELALAERPSAPSGTELAVSLRVADYAGVGASDAERVVLALRETADRLDAPLAPLALSSHPAEPDADVLSRLCETPAAIPADAAAAIERIAAARVLVTGTYHAAVFALALGIPVVCLTASDYYEAKFEGLRQQFGTGCDVISLAGSDAPARMAAAVQRLWDEAPTSRDALIGAARRQVDAGRVAYRELRTLVESPQCRRD